MKITHYTLKFLTPAFLGNAEQKAQWRTPPIKSLLRQWWRVVYAEEKEFNVNLNDMRHAEGLIFGHAGFKSDNANSKDVTAQKSQLIMRLSSNDNQTGWGTGSQDGVAPLSVGAETSYAWFGLINKEQSINNRSAIKIDGKENIRQLRIAYPDHIDEQMQSVLFLVNAFGLLGSRSRGGWGSLQIMDFDCNKRPQINSYTRDLSYCLEDDWAMSFAKDDHGPLIWEKSELFSNWVDAMTFISKMRKQIRGTLKEPKDLRPVLGNQSNGRSPSPLHWKVVSSHTDKLKLKIFALPHKPHVNSGYRVSSVDLLSAWHKVAQAFDKQKDFKRLDQS